jgi:stage IV sporulation protein FB
MVIPRLKIGLTFVLLVAGLILWENSIWIAAEVMAALSIHEISHILTCRLLGYQITQLKLTAFGGCLIVDPLFEANPNAEMIIAAAGPAVNFLMALSVFYLEFLGFRHDFLRYWQQLNLGMGLVNLIPAYPLDGGRIVHAWMVKTNGLKIAARVMRGITLGVALFFLVSGSIQLTLKNGGFTFLTTGLLIIVQLWRGQTPDLNFWQIRRQKQRSLHQKGFINARLIRVEPGTPLRLPLQYYGTHEYLLFAMEDTHKNLQLISEDQAWNILSREGYQATFAPKSASQYNLSGFKFSDKTE